jgi:hypothetical protein
MAPGVPRNAFHHSRAHYPPAVTSLVFQTLTSGAYAVLFHAGRAGEAAAA